MKYISSKILSFFILFLSVFFLLESGLVTSANAAEWRVIPIRLDFNNKVKSDVISVKNDGDEPLQVSVSAMEWTQDEGGKDLYEESSDLIFFPKNLTVKPKSERVIRTGIKAPAIKQEKAYRLFIKEEKAPSRNSSQVAVALRFGLPVFVKPLEEKITGEITEVEISDGKIEFIVRNRGNTHFRTTRIDLIGKDAAGQQIFSQEIQGWYVLAGSDQLRDALIPLEFRSQLETIDIKIVTDRMELFKSISYPGLAQGPLKTE